MEIENTSDMLSNYLTCKFLISLTSYAIIDIKVSTKCLIYLMHVISPLAAIDKYVSRNVNDNTENRIFENIRVSKKLWGWYKSFQHLFENIFDSNIFIVSLFSHVKTIFSFSLSLHQYSKKLYIPSQKNNFRFDYSKSDSNRWT